MLTMFLATTPACWAPGLAAFRHTDVVAHITGGRIATYDTPGLGEALKKLEASRRSDFEDWLDSLGLDGVVYPCNGDVGKADSDVTETSADEAWRNGVLFSNGNCAIRQYDIPTISVPMGVMSDTKMPVNLTFASKAYDDSSLLRYAYAFEKNSKLRQIPPRTPDLPTDRIKFSSDAQTLGSAPPRLTVKDITETKTTKGRGLYLNGSAYEDELTALRVYVDGVEQAGVQLAGSEWTVDIVVTSEWEGREEERGTPGPRKAMVIVEASGKNGKSSAELLFL